MARFVAIWKENMLPAIGVMIGAYIITRMLDLLSSTEKKTWVKIFGVMTILITLVSVIDLLNAGSRMPPGVGG